MAGLFAAPRRASKNHLVLRECCVFLAQAIDVYQVFMIGLRGASGLPALKLRQSTALQQCNSPRFITCGHAVRSEAACL
ncbi:hypothetical protein FVF58_24785 [Paraburkholderia panacisoli]|uniref:Uncharacterized protein n=1 Tax=Paraburkholderia panacisoli TaxID=2603818 RepID=A0A5B0GX08_9BURK|nr:hypothetical protein [Paraburkholderia panacisoli]KAA1007342.1 hypothetical protein FVF58_24785 [Paraburkholderia panacisoli]